MIAKQSAIIIAKEFGDRHVVIAFISRVNRLDEMDEAGHRSNAEVSGTNRSTIIEVVDLNLPGGETALREFIRQQNDLKGCSD